MGCFGGKAERGEVAEQQKWDYITLSDFKGRSCGAVFSYIWLWILVIVTIGVYVADTFTAVKLLAFNQWSSEIQPAIPFTVAKWIFSGCIIMSWVLAIMAWINAYRIMSRGCVTDDYLNSTAVTFQSIRPGSGWKRFLVFAALTKSRKKVSWVAIYVFFQRQGAVRLLAAEAPRQVVNALTLMSVGKAKFLEPGKGADRSGFDQFWYNFKVFANQNQMQVVILCSMAFTLIIWVISFLMLLLALILYIMFLWHHIRNETLSGFCRRKVETRLARIVKAKSDKEFARQQKKWEKAEEKALRKASSTHSLASTLPPKLGKQPTLPSVAGSPTKESMLFRTESSATTMTLPPYSSRAGTPLNGRPPNLSRAPTLPDLSERPSLNRLGTSSSSLSVNSDAPLLSQAGGMGYSDPRRPSPLPRSFTNESQSSLAYSAAAPSMARSFTGSTSRSLSTTQQRPPLPPLATQQPIYTHTHPHPVPSRSNTSFSSTTPLSSTSYGPRHASPASYEMTPFQPSSVLGDYFPPQRAPTAPPPSSRNPTPVSLQIGPGPRRDLSGPSGSAGAPWPGSYQVRSATAPVPDERMPMGALGRSWTAGPGPGPAHGPSGQPGHPGGRGPW